MKTIILHWVLLFYQKIMLPIIECWLFKVASLERVIMLLNSLKIVLTKKKCLWLRYNGYTMEKICHKTWNPLQILFFV